MDKNSGLAARVFWLLRHRPRHLYGAARGYILFKWARLMRQLMGQDGISLAENVRLQRNSSLMAESPHASISVGAHSIIYEDARIEAYKHGNISIGACSIIGDAHIVSRYRIQIGERFLSSWNVFIQDYDAHPTITSLRQQQVEHIVSSFRPTFVKQPQLMPPLDWDFPGEEIVIGDDVWVGAGATILKGAKIGSGSIIATGAVVLRGCYAPNSLIAGNPARAIKTLALYNVNAHPMYDQNHSENLAN